MADKRKSPPLGGEMVLSKRTRNALISREDRTRSLASPVMALTEAHTADVLDVQFAPDGQTIAAASADHTISLWETFGEHRNIGQLAGHKAAVTCLAWVPGSGAERLLLSGSADSTIVLWNSATGERVRRLRGHRGIVNSVACTRAGGRWASASDDGRVLFWAPDSRYPVASIELGYPVTCVEFSDDGTQLFVGGVDNAIHVMDCATASRQSSLLGHTDTVASLSLSPAGTHLLSSALDNTVRVWDVRPFAPPPAPGVKTHPRLVRTLTGMPSGFEHLLLKAAWSPDGEWAGCGGADHTANLWNVEKGTLVFKLPGHRGTCTAIDFHPHEPIFVSASTDGTLLLSEWDADETGALSSLP
ncbi:Similar to S.cerevisiae protein TAF5 (Subunit (90 kDa) of TFIID and SAGA complexes) [Malassezia sympodialis ATCC 42132]|uniref:Similar to S.cerevisiae protein TAF5 (Subunit (90 kDa) of TFIID and SAGA complexes) n=1 Tax=Malassezia sympodialis (strain ATCC 42132) TaxID=1230383 RepID=A0A1M8A378_MALS4|nr:Similar to S.cerevisiae protein TAF5 (Subunit (90 kDa) of TFIID and SAGA complexes) [Malassezia sympodialis ATCC 42132]